MVSVVTLITPLALCNLVAYTFFISFSFFPLLPLSLFLYFFPSFATLSIRLHEAFPFTLPLSHFTVLIQAAKTGRSKMTQFTLSLSLPLSALSFYYPFLICSQAGNFAYEKDALYPWIRVC